MGGASNPNIKTQNFTKLNFFYFLKGIIIKYIFTSLKKIYML